LRNSVGLIGFLIFGDGVEFGFAVAGLFIFLWSEGDCVAEGWQFDACFRFAFEIPADCFLGAYGHGEWILLGDYFCRYWF
jgi:hypothetical protein